MTYATDQEALVAYFKGEFSFLPSNVRRLLKLCNVPSHQVEQIINMDTRTVAFTLHTLMLIGASNYTAYKAGEQQ